ncbi:uncharacterized protein N7459_004506 [Penicillium hispanicum]|uniref:uncharacterized protein n=1 Tax=Penicillium hispanicum TaxID=1080232 RepID=UPI0025419250|nr:uncharacterized protein N7459_004506 [Penicillium hispanicum]KAJ5584706.1 hypothetical protein N7459_004506 [Penicillium hispanicum]
MMPRRISSAFLKLDSAEVIRAKDQKARQGARAVTHYDHPHIESQEAGPATVSAVETKITQQDDGQKLALSTIPPIDNTSPLAQIGHLVSGAESCHPATKHAMPDVQLSQSPGISSLIPDSESPMAQKANRLKTNNASCLVMDAQRFSITDSSGGVVPLAIQDNHQRTSPSPVLTANGNDNLSHTHARIMDTSRSAPDTLDTATAPQLRRSSRKRRTTYWITELEANGDELQRIRNKPFTAGSEAEETTVSTPDPGLTSALIRKSSFKRKEEKPRLGSGKRRNSSKHKSASSQRNASSRKRKPQTPQLPLTADLVSRTQAGPPRSNITTKTGSSDGEHESKTVRDTLPILCNSSLGISGPIRRKTAIPHNEIIEISSASEEMQDPSSVKNIIDELDFSTHEAHGSKHDGRGKAVGKKLTDALRGIDVHAQVRPAIELDFHSTQRTRAASKHSKDHESPQAPSALYLRKHDFPASETVKDQEKAKFAVVREVRTRSETAPSRTAMRVLPPEDASLDWQEDPSLRKNLDSQRSTDIEIGKDSVADRAAHLGHDIPESQELNSAGTKIEQKTDDCSKYSEPDARLPPSERSYSPHSSSEEQTSQLGSSVNPGRGNDHTPESQRPLLSQPTPLTASASLSGIPKSVPRSTIVDRNGSPRLLFKATKALEMTQSHLDGIRLPTSVEMTESSSSAYDRDSNSERYSLDSASDEAQTLSKFRRDMLLEYGIEAEDLILKQNRSGLFRDKDQTHDTRKAHSCIRQEQEVEHESVKDSSDGGTTPGAFSKSYHSLGPNRGADEVGRETEQFARRHLQGERSLIAGTAIFNPSQPVPEPHQPLHQNDTDAMEWISSLQTAQRSAHNLLQETNQQLSTQLATEQETIRQVLQIYRQGCNRILDDLFQAQQVRMELYRQQMSSVKEQHTQICQELIRGLQELDQQVQQGP